MLCFLHILLITGYIISDSFTGNGFDESAIYLMSTGLDGFEPDGYMYLVASSLCLMLLALYLCFRIPSLFHILKTPMNKWIALFNLIIVGLFILQPIVKNIALYQGLFVDMNQVTSIDISPVIPLEVRFEKKLNIIYLYAEGFERNYLNEALFPGLAPNLRRLESSALAFTNIAEVYGTGWTIAGMVSSQCGLPLLPVANASKPGTFMPIAYCLGDILQENGYKQTYIGGASLKFGGKGNFYSTHDFDLVFGRDQLLDALPDETPLSDWGLLDETLFPLVEQELISLKNQNNPYALILLTLDTHPPKGYASKICEATPYRDGSDPMLNSIHCSDWMIDQFIKKLMNSVSMEDTLIIVGSDHLAPNYSDHNPTGKDDQRRNLFFVLNSKIEAGTNNRYASTLDIAPTILGMMGSNIDALNLGVDLLGSRKSVMELSSNPDKDIRIWSNRLSEFY